MNAAEALKISTDVSAREANKKSAALKKRRKALKKSVSLLRAERIKKIENQFRKRIESAVEYGEKETTITLSSDGEDCLRGEYKYLPTRIYRGIRSYDHAVGEGYLKYAPWGKYVKLALAKLRQDGFKCEVVQESVEYDTSVAYMNSGGECGSETPWWTRDTILRITWGEKA